MRKMMNSAKVFLAAMLACILALSCVGCKGDEEIVLGDDYVGTLKIGYYEAGYGKEFMKAWTEGYNEAHPDAKIYFDVDDTVATGAIGNRLETKSELCDIFMGLATNWQDWARKGFLEPLDDLYTMTNDDGNVFEEAMLDGYATYGKINGTRYVVPVSAGVNGFAYDRRLFRENGLKVPVTVDDLFDVVEQINALPCNNDSDINNDIAPFAWGGQVAAYWNVPVMTWWAQYDGEDKINEFYQMESPDVYKNREGLKKALEIFRQLICTGEGTTKNSLPKAMSKNHIMMQNDFVLGRAAMLVSMGGVYNETKDIIDEEFEMDMFPTPYIDGAKKDENGNYIDVAMATDFDFMIIPKEAENKELAKKFLLWVSTEEMAKAYLQHTGTTMSTFKFDFSEVDSIPGLPEMSKSMVRAIAKTKTLICSSDNPLVESGRLTTWAGTGAPYTTMVLDNKSPTEILNMGYDFASVNWDTYRKELGMI